MRISTWELVPHILRLLPTSVVLLILAADTSIASDIQFLVDANKSALGLLHSVDMEINVYRTHFRGKHLSKQVHLATWRWSRNGLLDRQRWIQHEGYPPNDDGLPQNLGDLLEDETQVRVLLNWDPVNPQSIDLYHQGTVRAWFGPIERWVPSPFPNPAGQFALMHIQANLNDARRELGELVNNSPHVQLIGKELLREHEVWKIEVEHPDSTDNGPFAGTRLEIFLDPHVNYMTRQLIAHIPDVDPTPAKGVPVRIEREVLAFKDAGNGAYIPTEMAARLYDVSTGELASGQRILASKITVNAPLPSDALDFRFPEHARVVENPAVDGIHTIHIWGPDNRAVREIRDYSEITGLKPVTPSAANKSTFSTQVFILVNIAVILAILVILVYRRVAVAARS